MLIRDFLNISLVGLSRPFFIGRPCAFLFFDWFRQMAENSHWHWQGCVTTLKPQNNKHLKTKINLYESNFNWNHTDVVRHDTHASTVSHLLKTYNNAFVAPGRASVARQIMLIYARQPSLQLPFRGKTHFILFQKMLKTLGKSTSEA